MLANPMLAELTIDDLSRRYEGSFVKYNDSVVLVKSFTASFGGKVSIGFAGLEGYEEKPFDYRLLDISRPLPRWVIVPDGEEAPYFINYTFARQFVRGFNPENTTIRRCRVKRNILPSFACCIILQEFYKEPMKKQRITLKEALNIETDKLLSSQILLSRNADGDSVDVFFREKYIGVVGKVLREFEQEMTELIGDYINEHPVGEAEEAIRRFGNAAVGQRKKAQHILAINEIPEEIDAIGEILNGEPRVFQDPNAPHPQPRNRNRG